MPLYYVHYVTITVTTHNIYWNNRRPDGRFTESRTHGMSAAKHDTDNAASGLCLVTDMNVMLCLYRVVPSLLTICCHQFRAWELNASPEIPEAGAWRLPPQNLGVRGTGLVGLGLWMSIQDNSMNTHTFNTPPLYSEWTFMMQTLASINPVLLNPVLRIAENVLCRFTAIRVSRLGSGSICGYMHICICIYIYIYVYSDITWYLYMCLCYCMHTLTSS